MDTGDDKRLADPAARRKKPMAHVDIDEIEPGIVVWLDPTVLTSDGRVCHTQDPPVARSGPFVCVATEGEMSTWAGLTTERRWERLTIRREWRSKGHKRWRRDAQFLADGASVWRGPTEVFVAASWQEVTTAENRGRLSDEGLAAVRKEIEAQRDRRHHPCEA